jgi:nucleotide-binding universal stress UspA family protein
LPLRPEDRLTLLTVVPQADSPDDEARRQAEDVLGSAREVLCGLKASVTALVCRGNPAEEILRAAEGPTDLLVVGACGRSSVMRFLLGSVAERVARYAHCPVLVVRPISSLFRKIVLGLDDSLCSRRAADWLLQFPLWSDSEVRLVTVVPFLDVWCRSSIPLGPPLADHATTLAQYEREAAQRQLEPLVHSFGERGKQAVTEIASGDPALGLLQVAEEEGADLIVVGSHGQGAVKRFLLGSVSEKVLRHAHCSVLVVRPQV